MLGFKAGSCHTSIVIFQVNFLFRNNWQCLGLLQAQSSRIPSNQISYIQDKHLTYCISQVPSQAHSLADFPFYYQVYKRSHILNAIIILMACFIFVTIFISLDKKKKVDFIISVLGPFDLKLLNFLGLSESPTPFTFVYSSQSNVSTPLATAFVILWTVGYSSYLPSLTIPSHNYFLNCSFCDFFLLMNSCFYEFLCFLGGHTW